MTTKKATYGPKAISIPRSAKYGAGARKSGAHKRNNGASPGRVGKRAGAAPVSHKVKSTFNSPAAGDRNKGRPRGVTTMPAPRKMPAARNLNVKRGSPVPPPTRVVYEERPEVPVRLDDNTRVIGRLLSSMSTGAGKGGTQFVVELPNGRKLSVVKAGNGFRAMHRRVK